MAVAVSPKNRARAARAAFKWLGILPLLALYLAVSCGMLLLPASKRTRRARLTRNTSFFSRLILPLLGVRVSAHRRERLRKTGRGRLCVSNHLSYVDVLVISSLMPSVFITSVEMKHAFLLGMLATFGGCVYVERRSRTGLKREIDAISRVLDEGFSVVLFPEGTTSNGDGVRQFKISLLDSAVRAKADVIPLCLRYGKVNSRNISARNRDFVYYYGGMKFFKHFPRLLMLKSIDAELTCLKTIPGHAYRSRKELAALSYDAICAVYGAGKKPR